RASPLRSGQHHLRSDTLPRRHALLRGELPPESAAVPSLSSLYPDLADAADNAVMFARLGRDLPGWVRHPIGDDEVIARVRRSVETRETRLLRSVERLVCGHPRRPPRAL